MRSRHCPKCDPAPLPCAKTSPPVGCARRPQLEDALRHRFPPSLGGGLCDRLPGGETVDSLCWRRALQCPAPASHPWSTGRPPEEESCEAARFRHECWQSSTQCRQCWVMTGPERKPVVLLLQVHKCEQLKPSLCDSILHLSTTTAYRSVECGYHHHHHTHHHESHRAPDKRAWKLLKHAKTDQHVDIITVLDIAPSRCLSRRPCSPKGHFMEAGGEQADWRPRALGSGMWEP